MKKILLLFSLLSSRFASGQIGNGSFENWDTVFTTSDCTDLSNLFNVLNPLSGTVDHWTNSSGFGICQSTDSHNGDYSLILHNWYGYAQGWISYNDSISSRPKYLQGYFKYNTGGLNGLSYGNLYVAMTRYNGLSNDTIGTGIFQFDSTESYTPFQVELNYTSFFLPDSIHIFIVNGVHPCLVNSICHILYIDNITIGDSPLGVESLVCSNDFASINYDLFNDHLNIANRINAPIEFSFFNLTGESIMHKFFSSHTNNFLVISDLPTGIYFYRLSSEKNFKTGKLIKY
jgi:hypothetical protein